MFSFCSHCQYVLIGNWVLAPFHRCNRYWPLLIWLNGPFWPLPTITSMTPPKEPPLGKDQPSPKLARLEEAREIIEEYAADLREIIKKLRRHPS
jgi:hypothetical protein